jgi:hypothetical protein
MLQLAPLQRYGEQLDFVGVEQAPAPLQNATGV